MTPDASHRPAGLRVRVFAFAIDYLPILAYLALVVAAGAVVGRTFPEALARPFAHPASAQATGFALVTLPVVLYFALSEASVHRATWGKRRRGLQVVGVDGGRLGLARSSLRTCLKFVPWELAHTAVWGMSLSGGDPAPTHLALLALVWVLVGVNAVGILVWQRAPYDVVAGARVVRCGRRARAR